jgi:hypothetical protein
MQVQRFSSSPSLSLLANCALSFLSHLIVSFRIDRVQRVGCTVVSFVDGLMGLRRVVPGAPYAMEMLP